jgi:hypothetical protein
MHECCENQDNRVLRLEDQKPDKPEIQAFRCVVCNRRHLELTVDPGVLGLELKG